jgi:hypothetical protein
LIEFLTFQLSLHTTSCSGSSSSGLTRPHVDVNVKIENITEHPETKRSLGHALDESGRTEDRNRAILFADINSGRLLLNPSCPAEPTCLSPLVRSQPTFTNASCDIVISYEDMLFCSSLISEFWNPTNPVAAANSVNDTSSTNAPCVSAEKPSLLRLNTGTYEESLKDEKNERSKLHQPLRTQQSSELLEPSMTAIFRVTGLRIILIDNLLGLHLPFIQVRKHFDILNVVRSCIT